MRYESVKDLAENLEQFLGARVAVNRDQRSECFDYLNGSFEADGSSSRPFIGTEEDTVRDALPLR